MWILIGIVILFAILHLLPNAEPGGVSSMYGANKPCRGHKWKEIEQPGMEDDQGRPTVYLRCSQCNKTLQEILFD